MSVYVYTNAEENSKISKLSHIKFVKMRRIMTFYEKELLKGSYKRTMTGFLK